MAETLLSNHSTNIHDMPAVVSAGEDVQDEGIVSSALGSFSTGSDRRPDIVRMTAVSLPLAASFLPPP